MSFTALLENNLLVDRCTVFKWFNYEFKHDKKDKFCITLNCKLNEFPINLILTTSRYDKHYYKQEKNMIDCVVIEKGESKYFNVEKTIIDLKNIFIMEEDKMMEAFEDEFLVLCGKLEEHLVTRLEKAIENSELLEPYKIKKLLCKDR
ncbi:MAG: hypothetical protein H6Q35_1383 [Proteobacteria bacterium]|nr:hypothetical protein [Pseudomonadota bacterium]